MKSRRNAHFRNLFNHLPEHVRRQAVAAYELFAQDPWHRSLQFKQVHERRPIYSVRIGRGYRAVGIWEGDVIAWFWIGSHAEYDQLLERL
ncbi:MAG: hypothetical protein A2Z03_03015 [Chloroflexi bacterium RBG_16_56_8]|nr:MAG: hypothetical protein A2Z03_03015 [Chloroflexi bacterium RBG_16_56_8]